LHPERVPKPTLRPRKQPVQARSRATVDAIVRAAADVLVRRGPAKLTTNAIAERAGVNIASLYQYFPNKESIVAELRRRHALAQRAAVAKVWVDLKGAPIEEAVRAMVAVGVAAHAAEPRLHCALAEMMPGRVERSAEDDARRREFRRALAQTDAPDAELALWLIDTVVHAALHRAAAERPRLLSDPRFADELTALVLGYFRRPRAARRGRGA
jgi:AcrR family transcriptional regulator